MPDLNTTVGSSIYGPWSDERLSAFEFNGKIEKELYVLALFRQFLLKSVEKPPLGLLLVTNVRTQMVYVIINKSIPLKYFQI